MKAVAAQRSSEFKWSSKTGQKHLSWSYMYTTEAVSRHVGVCGVRMYTYVCACMESLCSPCPPPYPIPLPPPPPQRSPIATTNCAQNMP